MSPVCAVAAADGRSGTLCGMPGLEKVRSAVARRAFEARLRRLRPDRDVALVDLGTTYGGWLVPPDAVQPGWTCWSIGIGGDVSFDLGLLERGAVVRTFDPLAEEVALAERELGPLAGGRMTAQRLAIHVRDEPVRMRKHPDHAMHSMDDVSLYPRDEVVEVPGRSIPSLREEHGDLRVELLKIDVEGAEYELVPTLDLDALGVQVLMVQLHRNGGTRGALELVEHLRGAGLAYVGQRPVTKLTFVR